MAVQKLKLKQILGGGVLLSLAYNLVWIGVFALLANLFVEQMILVAFLFLMFYIFIAQPVKDWLFTHLITRYVYADRLISQRLEQRAQGIDSMQAAYKFLTDTARQWRQPRGLSCGW